MAVDVVRKRANPLDFAIKELGLTRADFGRNHDLGKQYLLRLSQGRHSQISATVLAAIETEAERRGLQVDLSEALQREWGTYDLNDAFSAWVSEHRQLQTIPDPVPGKANPFARLVEAAGGIARMSALLAVPDQLVERYAKMRSTRMPHPIEDALVEMQYPHLKHLKEGMALWKERHGV